MLRGKLREEAAQECQRLRVAPGVVVHLEGSPGV